jgi:hypothetical protein
VTKLLLLTDRPVLELVCDRPESTVNVQIRFMFRLSFVQTAATTVRHDILSGKVLAYIWPQNSDTKS